MALLFFSLLKFFLQLNNSSLETRLFIRIKPAIFFSVSLSHVRPETRFDLTCDPFGRRENNVSLQ